MNASPRCPKCKSDDTRVFDRMGVMRFSKCRACGHAWRWLTRRGW